MKVTMRKKYRTRCGTPVKILTTTRKGSPCPVVALLHYSRSTDWLLTYTLGGKIFPDGVPSDLDLVEVVETEES